MKLNELKPREARQARKRVGRGIASGTGKTAGRGHKGQKSRSGVSINGFEGGQMPIFIRLPKRGFTNIFRKTYQEVNIGSLQKAVDAKKIKDKVDTAVLVKAGLIRKEDKPVKLLAKGELKAALTIAVDAATGAAIKAVEKAGGKVSLPKKVEEKPSKEAK